MEPGVARVGAVTPGVGVAGHALSGLECYLVGFGGRSGDSVVRGSTLVVSAVQSGNLGQCDRMGTL